MTIRDHISALFIGALYYWYVGDILAAETCLCAALQINTSAQDIIAKPS